MNQADATSPAHRRRWLQWPQTLVASAGILGARTAIVAAFGIGMAYAAFNAIISMQATESAGIAGTLVVLSAMAVLGGALLLARRGQPLPPWPFVLLALLAGTLLRLIYFAMVEPTWVSDFARYWRIANEMANADHYVVLTVYEQRALPYLVPLVELFGNTPNALKLANIAVLGFVQLAGYDVLRRCHGHQAAQCFTLLWIGAPEPLFSLTIPSHDLVAMGILGGIAWLLTLAVHLRTKTAQTRFHAPWWLLAAPLVAALLAVLEVQRGIGLIALASLVAVALTGLLVARCFPRVVRENTMQAFRLLAIALLCIPLYATSMWGVARAGLMMSERSAEVSVLRYTTAHVSSLSDGSYSWFLPFNTAFTSTYMEQPERMSELRNSLALSDFIESPAGRLDNARNRLKHLYRLGGSSYFYMAGFAKEAPDAVKNLRRYNDAYAFGFAILTISALAVLLSRPGLSLIGAGFPLVLVSAVAIVLVVAAENQPRYLYLVWFVGAMVIASGLSRVPGGLPARITMGRTVLATGGIVLQSLLVIAVGTAVAWLAVREFYGDGSGRILSRWQFAADPSPHPEQLDAWLEWLRDPPSEVLHSANTRYKPLPRSFGPMALTLELPAHPREGDEVRASRQVCSTSHRDDLSFFVYTPYKNLPRSGAFELRVAVDENMKWRLALPHAAMPVPFDVPNALPRGRCSELTFILHSNVTQDRASWQRASRVEIYFPRLVDVLP